VAWEGIESLVLGERKKDFWDAGVV